MVYQRKERKEKRRKKIPGQPIGYLSRNNACKMNKKKVSGKERKKKRTRKKLRSTRKAEPTRTPYGEKM
jgi:hypothetical protein